MNDLASAVSGVAANAAAQPFCPSCLQLVRVERFLDHLAV